MNDPALLLEMLALYSELFMDSAPCSTCEQKHKIYYRRLLREGTERIKKNKIMAEKTCELKKNVVLYFEGNHFTNVNITDKVARAILKGNPANEKNFKAYPKGYEVATEEAQVADAKKNLAKAREGVSKVKNALEQAEENIVKTTKATEELAGELKAKEDELAAADDNKKKALTAEVKKKQEEHDSILETQVEAEEKVPALKTELEEAEANSDKYESLLHKRDK